MVSVAVGLAGSGCVRWHWLPAGRQSLVRRTAARARMCCSLIARRARDWYLGMAMPTLPLQVVILSRVPIAYRLPGIGTIVVILYSAAVLFVWLTYAKHAEYWLPYQVYPIA